MADLQLPKEATLIASTPTDPFTKLDAMFDAIRAYLPDGLYEHSLASIGQCVASRGADGMRGLAGSLVRKG